MSLLLPTYILILVTFTYQYNRIKIRKDLKGRHNSISNLSVSLSRNTTIPPLINCLTQQIFESEKISDALKNEK